MHSRQNLVGLIIYFFMKNSHHCKALVISCIDYRFVSRIRDFLVGQGLLDNYDLITVPGASLGFANISGSITTSINLHNPDEILIFDHEDCGAYGENNSKKLHSKNLMRSKQILAEKHPNKTVKTYISGFKKIDEVS
ncbi:hypothetical protein IH981_01805 [Patescibacteria group bacterium]|nr:hypothetical protein [Patescibacteria group bacterium]